MESLRNRSFVSRTYEDFQPSTEWISDDTSETLAIRLPGFSKEHLKVQMDNLGNLRVIGERPLDAGGRQWSRFKTEHPIPYSCDVRGVMARFYDNILNITFPKLITEELKPATPTPKPELEPSPETKPSEPVQKQETESRKEEEEVVKEKKKVEEEQRDVDDGEKAKNSGVNAAPVVPRVPEKMGIGFFPMRITRRRQVVVNMFVAVVVIVVIGIYVGYKLRSGGWGGRGE